MLIRRKFRLKENPKTIIDQAIKNTSQHIKLAESQVKLTGQD
jgi:hypothetical protein